MARYSKRRHNRVGEEPVLTCLGRCQWRAKGGFLGVWETDGSLSELVYVQRTTSSASNDWTMSRERYYGALS